MSLQAAGVYLKLMNPTKQVREILKVTELESIFEIWESESTDEVAEVGVINDRSEATLGPEVASGTDGSLIFKFDHR
jgi:hypothetical protein